MRLFRQEPVAPEPTTPIDTRRLSFTWDPVSAQYHYRLEVYSLRFTSQGNFYGYWKKVATGDKDWAQKNADHYNIPMPTEQEKS